MEEGRRRLPELRFAVYAVRCPPEVVTRLGPEYSIKCRGWLPNADVPGGVCRGEGHPACALAAVCRLALRRSDHLRVRGAGRWSLPRPHAVDLEDYGPVPPEEGLRCDLLFMGNRLPDWEERFWAFFAKAARRAPEKRLLLGGEDWGEHAPLPPSVLSFSHARS